MVFTSSSAVRARAGSTLALLLFLTLAPVQGGPLDRVSPGEIEKARARLESTRNSTTLDPTIRDRLLEIQSREVEALEARNRWIETVRDYEDRLRRIASETKSLEQDAARGVSSVSLPETAPLTEAVDLLARLDQTVPKPVDQVPLARLEEELVRREAERDPLVKTLNTAEETQKSRAVRRGDLPKLIASARTRIEELTASLKTPPTTGSDAPEIGSARTARDKALVGSLEAELQALEVESRLLEAEAPLLPLRNDRASRQLSRIQQQVKAWRLLIDARRRLEGVRVREEASRTLQQVDNELPQLRPLIQENARLASQRADLVQGLEQVSATLSEEEKRLNLIASGYRSLKQRGDLTGPSEVIARWLRQQRSKLPPTTRLRRRLRRHQEDLGRLQFELLEAQEARTRLSSLDQVTQDALEDLAKDPTLAPVPEGLNVTVRQIFESRRKLLDGLRDDYETYLKRLGRVVAVEEELLRTILAYTDDIDQRILWISSAATFGLQDITRSLEAIGWLTAPERATEVVTAFKKDVQAQPGLYVLSILFLLLLFSRHKPYRDRVRLRGRQIRVDPGAPFQHTLEGVFLSLIAAATWTLPIAFIGWRLRQSGADAPAFLRALGTGCVGIAWIALLLLFLRECLRLDGFFDAHLSWPQSVTQAVRRGVGAGWIPILAFGLVHIVIESQEINEEWKSSLGRIVFAFVMLGTMIQVRRIVGLRGNIVRIAEEDDPDGGFFRFRWLWRLGGIGLPLALMILSLSGYHYTSVRLATRLPATLSWLLICLFLQTIGQRWLRLLKKQILDADEREKQTHSEGEGPAPTPDPGAAIPTAHAPGGPPLPELDRGTQQAGDLLILLILGGGLLSIWNDVLPALSALDRIVLWSTTTMETISIPQADGTTIQDVREVPLDIGLANFMFAIVALVATLVLSRHLPQVFEGIILKRLPLEKGSRYALRAMVQYILTAVGLVFTSTLVGVRWAHVQWLVAAISVGLGFGLQEIFANFISGLILLTERPIRVGDIVTIGDVTGTVVRIQIRATTILDFDRRELVVPNKEFITGRFVNLTLSDRTARLVFPVGVAYGSDTERAQEILLKIATDCEHSLSDPAPQAVFRGFGDSSLNLELRVFIPTRDVFLQVLTHVNTSIDREFKQAGIEIAFPQRDLHLRSIDPKIPQMPFMGGGVEED